MLGCRYRWTYVKRKHDPDRGTDHHRNTHGPFTGLKAAPGPENAGDQRKKAQRTLINPGKSRKRGEEKEIHELTVRGEHGSQEFHSADQDDHGRTRSTEHKEVNGAEQ